MKFYDILSELCKIKNTTPTTIAKACGLSNSIAARWKSGSIPQKATLNKIAEYFGVTTDFLLGYENTPAEDKILTSLKEIIGNTAVKVPVYKEISADIPLEAITDIEEYEEINSEMALKGEHIALRIKEKSMEPRLMEGDVVIVRLQDDVNTGDVAVVFVNGDNATCKKVKKCPEGIWLLSFNPAFEPVFYSNQEIQDLTIRILGKVVESRCKY